MSIYIFLLLMTLTGNHLPVFSLPQKLPVPEIKICRANSNEPDFIFHGPRNRPDISLTFDADMTPYMKSNLLSGRVKSAFDHKIIEVLEKTNTPATFFVTGLWADTYGSQLKKISANPLFEIGNHTYDHPSFKKSCYGLTPLTDSRQKLAEITKTQERLVKDTNKPVFFFRFPGGCYSNDDLKILKDEGLKGIQWDVVSGDSFNNNAVKIKDNILKGTQNGSIIVMHLNGAPNAPKTGEILEDIINKLKKRGFTFKKVSDLLSYPGVCAI